MRSKRRVYSSSAASPRSRTSATIAATVASIAGSCAASKRISASSAASKPAARVSSTRAKCVRTLAGADPRCCRNARHDRALAHSRSARRLMPPPFHGRRERVDQRLHRVALQLERAGIDDQPRADRHDVLDGDEIVRLQRVAGRHEIDDRVGEADQRRQLHRAVELDQVDVHRLRGEMLARGAHVLGGDADARAALNGAAPVVAALRRDDEPAAADAKVERLIQAGAAVLDQHVLARDADVGSAVLHVRRDIGRPQEHELDARPVGREDQLARRVGIFGRHDARRLDQRQRLVEVAPLGQGDRQRGHDRISSIEPAILPTAVRYGRSAASQATRWCERD